MAAEITEEQRQENRKAMNLYFGTVTGVLGAYLLGYAGSLMESLALPFLPSCGEVFSRLGQMQFGFHLNSSAIIGAAAGVGLGAAVYFLESINQERTSAYDQKKVAGSARFLS